MNESISFSKQFAVRAKILNESYCIVRQLGQSETGIFFSWNAVFSEKRIIEINKIVQIRLKIKKVYNIKSSKHTNQKIKII